MLLYFKFISCINKLTYFNLENETENICRIYLFKNLLLYTVQIINIYYVTFFFV